MGCLISSLDYCVFHLYFNMVVFNKHSLNISRLRSLGVLQTKSGDSMVYKLLQKDKYIQQEVFSRVRVRVRVTVGE